ncbi:hypothetical protein I3J09_12640 [Streptomyces clavuligerus]|nr:hypothetical protein [Streptomyces clavuligerus]MBY6303535.1 hypothetical protein [Streptomyces clavuligerus]QPL63628.1 hypothetical protein I3J04_12625 [Streptomyces clavuligerus]QPL69656.1 hypothetical protein I3J05_12640 [Streptomyces clavuligerus]QPL75738.1 hypothetical protein I3J06_12640 [Streptomyces clavuligerus]QPL81764.1 hypothetical protein I3J07_12680 [Streptomyces clavuligerus]
MADSTTSTPRCEAPPGLAPLSSCSCGPGCGCGCQSGGSCQCGGGCG